MWDWREYRKIFRGGFWEVYREKGIYSCEIDNKTFAKVGSLVKSTLVRFYKSYLWTAAYIRKIKCGVMLTSVVLVCVRWKIIKCLISRGMV